MVIIIDDTRYNIESKDGEIDISFGGAHSFNSAIIDILTPCQYDSFIRIDTKRVFVISKKKEQILKSFL